MKKTTLSIFFILICTLFVKSQSCETVTTAEDIQELLASNSRSTGGSLSIKYFDVYHHIFLNDAGELSSTVWSEEKISNLMDEVNNTFLPAYIQFKSCITYHSDSYYNTAVWLPDAVDDYKVPDYMNIYYATSFNASRCGGTAFYPWSNHPGNLEVDCPDYQNSMLATLTHEIGHSFGLLHTHSGGGSSSTIPNCGTEELVNGTNCATTGDLICDTPADPNIDFQNSSNCYQNINPYNCQDNNGEYYNPDPTNFMSYSWPDCKSNFSNEQEVRMNYYASSSDMSPFLSSTTNFSNATYSSNQTFSDHNIEFNSLSISNGADVTLNACNVTIDNLTINSGSKITIQH
ncbi:MAG: M43 family zinc metalloprotease [Cyclobacteriaceae bacterium]